MAITNGIKGTKLHGNNQSLKEQYFMAIIDGIEGALFHGNNQWH